MKVDFSKADLLSAVLFYAREFNCEDSYKKMVDSGGQYPELVKSIITDMFVNKFNIHLHSIFSEYRVHYDIIFNAIYAWNYFGYIEYK